MHAHVTERLRILFQEAIARRRLLLELFALVLLGALLVGLNWPSSYSSYTTVFVEEENIIGPLMQGTAVQSDMNDRAGLAREIIYGRNIMTRVLELGDWKAEINDPATREGLIEAIKQRTEITNVGNNLIRIEYHDSDPQRAYQTTRNLAELFIRENMSEKARESSTAYEFIDRQVKQYKQKLLELDQKRKQFRARNADARPGAEDEVNRRIEELKGAIDRNRQALREAEIRRDSLEKQLSGEAATASSLSRNDRIRSRIAELQAELDRLRLSYHEQYPDIVHIKNQIENLRKSLKEEDGAPADGGLMAGNPVYQELRTALYQARIEIQTIRSRIAENERLLTEESERSRRIEDADAELAQLTRDYEVTRDIYQDLLHRREQARVSMDLNQEQRGNTLRVDEAAFVPHQASTPGLGVFLGAGLLLGIAAPLGGLFGIQYLDPRVRYPSMLSGGMRLPVLAVSTHLATPAEAGRERRGVMLSAVSLLGLVFFVLTVIAIWGGGAP